MSTRRDKRDNPQAPQPAVPANAVAVAKFGGTVALVAAAAMSAQTLYRLGRILGYAWWNAPLLPTSLDVYAATAIWVGHRVPAEHKARKTATTNARIALALTICSNGLFHLLNLPGVHLPRPVSITLLVLVSALPPFVVERILHLQMSVSNGRTAEPANPAVAAATDNAKVPVAEPKTTTPTANPALSLTTTASAVVAKTTAANANDNPAPNANRQNGEPAVAKTKSAAKPEDANDNAGADKVEVLVAATLGAYREILAANTGKRSNPRPTAPELVAAVDGLNTDSRAKQIREIIERRFPDVAPRLRAVEPVEQVG